jgi:hypothetical protein
MPGFRSLENTKSDEPSAKAATTTEPASVKPVLPAVAAIAGFGSRIGQDGEPIAELCCQGAHRRDRRSLRPYVYLPVAAVAEYGFPEGGVDDAGADG